MEYGEGPVGEGNQHATLHVPAIGEKGLLEKDNFIEVFSISAFSNSGTTFKGLVCVSYTRLSTESLSLMEWRHFFQFPTAEWT